MKKRMMAGFAAVCMLGVGTMGYGAGASEDFKGEINVGLCLGITGANATTGINFSQGIQEVVDQANANGGANGYKINIELVDSGDDTATATNAMNLMVDSDYSLVIGPHYSSQVYAVKDIIEKNGIPTIVGGTNFKLPSEENNYLFLGRTNDTIQAKAVAQYIAENEAPEKVGIMYSADDFGQGGLTIAGEVFDELGITYVAEPHNTADTDYYTTLMKMQQESCDAIMVWTTVNPMMVIVRQINELGMNEETNFFTSPCIGEAALLDAVDHSWLDGIYTVQETFYDTENPDVVAFGEAYEEKYGVVPDAAARAYASIAYIAVDALSRAEDPTDRESVKTALEETKDFETIFNTYSCDETHMLNHTIQLCQFQAEADDLVLIQQISGE